ncbi:MAG: hypothetical protein RR575_03760 [Acinetobacter sp.]
MRIDQRNNSKLIWIIAGALIVVSLFITVFFWINNDHKNTQVNDQFNHPIATQKKPEVATPPVAQPVQENAPSATANVELVSASILKDQVPQNASLAKEEFAKLEDIQKQLNEQQQNLKSQQADADQLIKLKEEQVKLLEQQLAAQAKA